MKRAACLMTTALATLLTMGFPLEARGDGGASAPAASSSAAYGFFGGGFHLEGGVGIYQVLGQVGTSVGFYPRLALEYELTSHISIPVVTRLKFNLEEGRAPDAPPDMAQISVAPGVLIRFREKEWPLAIAFGAGVRIGSFTARPELVGLPSADTTDEVAGFPFTYEATIKLEFWLTSWFPIKVSGCYAPVFIEGVMVSTMEQSVAAAIVF